MKIIKKELLRAMEQVLSEYKNKEHATNIDSCALCKLYYYNNENNKKNDKTECFYCPMRVFSYSKYEKMGCVDRKCRPIECKNQFFYFYEYELNGVIEFYELSIKKIKIMSEAKLNAPKAFSFLKKIDKQVAKKYAL